MFHMKVLLLITVVAYAGSTPTIVQPGRILRELADEQDQLLSGKIVNGQNAQITEFPWQISLQQGFLGLIWSHICGGNIIDGKWILTAAHCVDGQTAGNLRIRAGANAHAEATQTVSVSRIIMHPQYSAVGADGYPNDIALLELSSALTLTNGGSVNKIVLADAGENFELKNCNISGWGLTSGGGSSPTNLLYVTMQVITNSECRTRWQSVTSTIRDDHICIFEETKSACNGDSGGPMSCLDDSRTNKLAGVTSWGASGCDGTYPSVYTRVSSFRSWVSSQCNCV
ncbi:chymotrypsin-like serine proteinase [Mytilus edulis]|uniref:chymotrypsin-like serine proteinase n=1 Tax=Mytilus edulis TaxID=6550 RepID=UPI0039EED052